MRPQLQEDDVEQYGNVTSRLKNLESAVTGRLAVTSEAPLNIDDTRFGGSLAEALSYLGSAGGRVLVPRGDRDIGTTQINIDDRLDVTIQGEGSRYAKARLVSHLTGSGSVISARSTGGLRIEGLSIYNDQS